MKKQHLKPEFTVIRQNEANAKFFVASIDAQFTGVANPHVEETGQDAASQYGLGNDLDM